MREGTHVFDAAQLRDVSHALEVLGVCWDSASYVSAALTSAAGDLRVDLVENAVQRGAKPSGHTVAELGSTRMPPYTHLSRQSTTSSCICAARCHR